MRVIFHLILENLLGGGGTIPRLRKRKLWDELLEFQPDLTFLIIGENDIHQGTSARALGIAIESLCKEVEANTGGPFSCKYFGIERRSRVVGCTLDDFYKISNSVNRFLKDSKFNAGRFESIGVKVEDLDVDGVHLKEGHIQCLFESIVALSKDHFQNQH